MTMGNRPSGSPAFQTEAGRLSLSLACSFVLHLAILAAPIDALRGNDGVPHTGKQRFSFSVDLPVPAEAAVRNPVSITHASVQPATPPAPVLTAAAIVEPGPAGEPKADHAKLTPEPDRQTGPNISGPLGPWYYPARYLHRKVTPLKPIWPDYPPEAETVAGRVTILLFVNEFGEIDRYRIESAEPAGIFEASVIEAFVEKARYAPGMITGYPVRGQLLAEVSFEPGAPPSVDFSIMGTAKPLQVPASSRGKEN